MLHRKVKGKSPSDSETIRRLCSVSSALPVGATSIRSRVCAEPCRILTTPLRDCFGLSPLMKPAVYDRDDFNIPRASQSSFSACYLGDRVAGQIDRRMCLARLPKSLAFSDMSRM